MRDSILAASFRARGKAPTLYVQRVRNFVVADGILRVARVIVLVAPLHVPQSQGVVRPHVGPATETRPISHPAHRTLTYTRVYSLLLQFRVSAPPLDARPGIADDEAGHVNVHPPRDHDGHAERYYGSWNLIGEILPLYTHKFRARHYTDESYIYARACYRSACRVSFAARDTT